MIRTGAYFLGNDNCYENCVGFLKSFRQFNPAADLCLIPFDQNTQRLSALSAQYRFSIFDDNRSLVICDSISACFSSFVNGRFRKLAAWNGPYDRFVYFDVDLINLYSIDPVISTLDTYGFVSGVSNVPINCRWTWKKSALATGFLQEDEYAYAALTGVFASTKQALDFGTFLESAVASINYREHMVDTGEQPFLNLLVVRSASPRTSLQVLFEAGASEIPQELYAPDNTYSLDLDGKCYRNGKRLNVLALHWAGLNSADPNKFYMRWALALSNVIRNLVFSLAKPRWPRSEIWEHYRNLREE